MHPTAKDISSPSYHNFGKINRLYHDTHMSKENTANDFSSSVINNALALTFHI